MHAPQIVRTPGGEELVLLPRADYDALIRRLAEAEEDAADVAAYDAAKARLASGEDRILTPEESRAVLGRGAVLRALRKSKGLSQEELASAAGLSQAFLSKAERGGAGWSFASAERLAQALGVELSVLG